MGLGGWGAGWHDRSGGSAADADQGVAELDLVPGAELDGSVDAVAVDVGAVGGAEVLDDQGPVLGDYAGVPARDAGVRDHHVRGALLAAEDQLAVDRVLAAGPRALMDDQ